MIELTQDMEELRPRICVIGVGGAGGNAVANMMRSDVQGVEFIAANTDAQALRSSPVSRILQLGRTRTQGLGAGSQAELGKAAAEDSMVEIRQMLEGAHMCFIAAGLGGGTGSGAAPVIAEAAREMGILTVGVVTKPFEFEGKRRAQTAQAGLEELQRHVDTLIVIPNQNLFRIANADTTFKAAFDLADQVLQQGVRGITDLMTMPGLINLDFADIRTIMADMGRAMMGLGEATGDDRALRAAEQAISNPLLDEALKGARGLIISISGGDDLRLMEVDEVASHIKDLIDPDADIIWGSAFDQSLAGKIRVSIVATGIDTPAAEPVQPSSLAAIAESAAQAPALTAPRPATSPIFGPTPPPLFAPVAPPFRAAEQKSLPLEPPSAAPGDEELLLTVERELVLVPPQGAADFMLVDPFAAEAESLRPTPIASSSRGPSLFERMAMFARGETSDPHGLGDMSQEPRFFRPRSYDDHLIDQAA